ncbi:uncharacterized protein LOC123674728 [Harmonia axyridis]|uniref:uncharacterized protein LOC123674728 n=1 Tax=Harmonia axyridis TaxID=115357 RepID=UPI001E277D90|nr:uncharacterized protein LOC123674728 [Harmonia axyridis]
MLLFISLWIFGFLAKCECDDTGYSGEHVLLGPAVPGQTGFGFVIPEDIISSLHHQKVHYHKPSTSNPLLEALLLSKPLAIPAKFTGHNTLQHQPINPYIALLLSHYGRYVAAPGEGKGIYSYVASNNYHNNKPFGSYKIYEEGDS